MVVLFIPCLIVAWIYNRIVMPLQESREPNYQFRDPIHDLLPKYDLSCLVRASLYTALLQITAETVTESIGAIQTFWLKYTALLVVKTGMLYLTPWNTPFDHQRLKDPLLAIMGGLPTDQTYSRDLMFSGHVGLLTLVALNSQYYLLAYINLIIMATSVLVHRNHYTIDVVVAPFVAYVVNTIV